MLAVAVVSLAGAVYALRPRHDKDQKISKKTRHDTERMHRDLQERGGGYFNTSNNFAYLHSIPRDRSNSLTFYEAEALGTRHEITDAIRNARGHAGRMVAILGEWYRARDRAIQNVAQDYDKQTNLIQIRRQEGVPSNQRIAETIADHPKFDMVHRQVPHYKSVPIPHSMGKNFWRPNQYHKPGYTLVKGHRRYK